MLLVGRVTGPEALFELGGRIAEVPVSWSDVLSEGFPNAEGLVDPSAPFDLGFMLGRGADGDIEDPTVVLSFGLSSLAAGLDYARRQAGSREEGGVYYFEGGFGGPCAVAPALGPAPARAVCAEEQADVEAVLAYMTQGLPLEPHGVRTGLELELRAEPTRKLFQPNLSELSELSKQVSADLVTGNGRLDAVLGKVVSTFEREALALTDDVELLTAVLSIVEERQLVVAVSAKLRQEASFTARFMLDAAERACSAPALFWSLPVDAGRASYSCEVSPTQLGGLRRQTGELVQSILAWKQASPQLRIQLRRATANALTLPGTYVWAQGSVPDAPVPGMTESAREARKLLGWVILGSDQSADAYLAYLRNTKALLNSGEFLSLLELDTKNVRREELAPALAVATAPPAEPSASSSADLLGLFNRTGARARERVLNAVHDLRMPLPPEQPVSLPKPAPSARIATTLQTVVERPPRGAKLPKGSVTFEVEIPDSWLDGLASAPKRRSSLRVAVVVVADEDAAGSRTWIGVGADERIITTRLAAVLAAQRNAAERNLAPPSTAAASMAPPSTALSGSLATLGGLEQLKQGKSVAGGFVDLRAMLADLGVPTDGIGRMPIVTHVNATHASAAHTNDTASGSSPTLEIEAIVDLQALREFLLAAAPHL